MSMTTTGSTEAVALSRRNLAAIAILACVPLPLLSLGAMAVPLPQFVERAAASFMSLAAPVLDSDGPVIRERRVAVRSVEIVYTQHEQRVSSTDDASPTHAASGPSSRGVPTRGDLAAAAAEIPKGGGTQATPADPDAGPTDDPTDEGAPGGGDGPVPEDPRTGGGGPGDGQPAPGPQTEPPSSTPPAPGGGAGSGGGGGTGGGGSSGGGGTGGGKQEPPSSGGTPPGGGGGKPTDPGTGPTEPPGNGNGSPPEAPPGKNDAPPGGGNGRP